MSDNTKVEYLDATWLQLMATMVTGYAQRADESVLPEVRRGKCD